MAHESAVENLAELQTTTECAGCGQALNLLGPHLLLTVKPQRAVIETVDAALVGAETDDEGNIVALAVDVTSEPDELDTGRERYFIGYKKGEGVQVNLHNYACAATFAQERDGHAAHERDGVPRMLMQRVDPEAEGRSSE